MKRIFCIAVFAALFGCKQIPTPGLSNSGGDVEPVLLSDVRILFEAPAFAGQQVSRAKITDTWQREEYALFRTPRAQAEIVYLAATARETSLEMDVTLKTMIRRWNFNGQAGITRGTKNSRHSAESSYCLTYSQIMRVSDFPPNGRPR